MEQERGPPVKFPCFLVSKSNLLQSYNIEVSQKLIKILSPNKGKVKSKINTENVHAKMIEKVSHREAQ